MLPNINPIWTYFFLICGHVEYTAAGQKKKKLFFLFYMQCPQRLPSRAVGRPEESWTKWWGWLRQGVFRASLPHNRPHQDTLAHWRGHLQSLKEIMPLISTATLHIWRHVQQLTEGPVLYNQGFTSKFIWPKIRHLPHGLRWETQSGWSLLQLEVRHFQVLRQGWPHSSFGTLRQMNPGLNEQISLSSSFFGSSRTGKS